MLIQELFRSRLTERYPALEGSVGGEESNTIACASSAGGAETEDVTIAICSDVMQTAARLARALPPSELGLGVARRLAEIVHGTAELGQRHQAEGAAAGGGAAAAPDTAGEDASARSALRRDGLFDRQVAVGSLGLWIDPLDGTNEFIGPHADEVQCGASGIYPGGLPVVTVLIGVYDIKSGVPLAGVVNQPFWRKRADTATAETGAGGGVEASCAGAAAWQGRHFWGVSLGDGLKSHSEMPALPATAASAEVPMLSVASSSESAPLRRELSALGALHTPAGAGYKLLCVVMGVADAYVLSKSSTYKWDTCAPHAILNAIGGVACSYRQLPSPAAAGASAAAASATVTSGAVSCAEDVRLDTKRQILYNHQDCNADSWKNSCGLIMCGRRVACDDALLARLHAAINSAAAAQQ